MHLNFHNQKNKVGIHYTLHYKRDLSIMQIFLRLSLAIIIALKHIASH